MTVTVTVTAGAAAAFVVVCWSSYYPQCRRHVEGLLRGAKEEGVQVLLAGPHPDCAVLLYVAVEPGATKGMAVVTATKAVHHARHRVGLLC